MHEQLTALLAELRARRHFEVTRYVTTKAMLLDAYLKRSGIKACVVAVSGGVDSAITLGLVREATRVRGSPVERVVAALMPIFVEGATGQQAALDRGREVAAAFGASVVEIDLSGAHDAMRRSVEEGFGAASSPWSRGQLVSNLRTPALYHVATLLTQQGLPALICGTTNRDEGSYLGFFGKASDGMVDVQLISDLHKSEVFAVARRLGVPASVLAATPTGDTYDGRPDEAMIGAPYDFVELYTSLRCLDEQERGWLLGRLQPGAAAQYAGWASAVEALHRHNAHKYLGDSPAVHLDVHERAVPGGWRAPAPRPPTPVDHGAFVGEFPFPTDLTERLAAAPSPALRASPLTPDFDESAFLVEGLLDDDECAALRDVILAHEALPAGRHGAARGFDPARGPAASFRSSVFDERLARALWARLSRVIPAVRAVDDHTSTDHDGHRAWRAVGVSPLMRFIRYEKGGWLVPHTDSTHDTGDGLRRTLMSVLVYLTDAGQGSTLFLLDRQRHLPVHERRFRDGKAPPRPLDVLARPALRRGSALVFDHRIPHAGDVWQEETPKLVLRTDILFARCGLPALSAASPPPSPPLPLGLSPGATRAEADAAYLAARDASPELRLRWKALRDPFYGRVLASLGSLPAIEEAGFFDDGGDSTGEDPRADPSWFATPIHHLTERLATPLRGGWAAVLLSTGSFCPIHEGHIRMMELARQELERRGALVLGGYLSPSHDSYVQLKCGEHNPGAASRVRMCEEAVREYPWLEVDPWEALHASVALNFTEVIARLERYLSAHLPTPYPVHVVYVFGGDNARFSLSFLHRGHSLCIPRPGHQERVARYENHPLLRGNTRVMFAEILTPNRSPEVPERGGEASVLTPNPSPEIPERGADPRSPSVLGSSVPLSGTSAEKPGSEDASPPLSGTPGEKPGSEDASPPLSGTPGEKPGSEDASPPLSGISGEGPGGEDDANAPGGEDHGPIDISSSQIRAGEPGKVPAGARALWTAWQQRRTPGVRRRLLLRDEGDWSVEPWRIGREPGALSEARRAFFDGLQRAFREAHADEGGLDIVVLDLHEQRRRVAGETHGHRVISLDPCIEGDINLGVSRLVPLGGDEPRRLSRRPGAPPLEDQLGRIAPGVYLLLDDDTFSGATLTHVTRELTRQGVQISGTLTASALVAGRLATSTEGGLVEVCDGRDFLVGSREAGAATWLPGRAAREHLARAPYLLPYVSPSRRASVPLARELSFSRQVWALNAAFFASVTPALRVADASPAFRELAAYLGFDGKTPLEHLCAWHIERLEAQGSRP